MLAPSIAREAEQRRRRLRSCEGPIVTDIGPQAARRRLAAGQHRDGGVVAVQPLGGKHMSFDPPVEQHQRRGAGADLVGERRQTERHASPS